MCDVAAMLPTVKYTTISCIKISTECLVSVVHCSPGMLWGYGSNLPPTQGSFGTVKTNHKIVILFTAENFIAVMGGESKENS